MPTLYSDLNSTFRDTSLFALFGYSFNIWSLVPIHCLNNDNISNQDTQSSICLFRIGLRIEMNLLLILFCFTIKINQHNHQKIFSKDFRHIKSAEFILMSNVTKSSSHANLITIITLLDPAPTCYHRLIYEFGINTSIWCKIIHLLRVGIWQMFCMNLSAKKWKWWSYLSW